MVGRFMFNVSRVIILLFLMVTSVPLMAQNKVVVVPLVGNGFEVKPIKPSDLIEKRLAFTTFSNRLIVGNVSDDRGIIITSITVSPEQYPASLSPIALRFCRTSGSCSHGFTVPNNTISTIDYGIGDIFSGNGQHYIDLTSRGGLPQNVANQIVVFVSGYYYDK